MNKIKIAFIGAGHDHAFSNINRFKDATDLYEVMGYHIPEDEALQEKPEIIEKLFEGMKKLSLDEILQDTQIEAVVIETVDKILTKYALLAAKAKKHIFMDKPGSGSLEEFENLISEIKKNNLVFETGYMYRYNPFVIKLKEEIKKGNFGEILGIEAQMNCLHPKDKRDWLADYPGGMMHFLGCHLVDLIYSIQGEPKNIIPLSRRTGLGDALGVDFGMAVFEYENSVSFAKTSGVEYGGFHRRNLTVVGSKKTVELCPFECFDPDGKMFTEKTEYSVENWQNRGEKDKVYFDRYEKMVRSFYNYVKGIEENPVTPDYELNLYKLVLKACGK